MLPQGNGDELRGLEGVQVGFCPEGRTEKAECGGVVSVGTRAALEHDITGGLTVNIRTHNRRRLSTSSHR